MAVPVYYVIDADGYLIGARTPQLDPLETQAQGVPVYMAPGARDVTVVPPTTGANQTVQWDGSTWTIVADYRGELWYTDWDQKVPITTAGVPQNAWRTREEIPVSVLKAFGQRIVFNWGYYKKYGDNEDVTDGAVNFWADSLSLQQLMLEYMYADAVGGGYSYPYTWYGKNGATKVVNNLQDFRSILLAYRNKQDSVNTLIQQKKQEAQAATTRQEIYDIVNGMWNDLLATGDWYEVD